MALTDRIPKNLASKTEWRRRGYRPKRRERPFQHFKIWNVMSYMEFGLYEFGQLEPIPGKQANLRRINFTYKLLKEVENGQSIERNIVKSREER